jgi:hypothetical protein
MIERVAMLATWTWNQLGHEISGGAAFVVVLVCLSYFSLRGLSILKKQRRFSLLDLLVAITLVGATAGAFIGLATDDKKGIPAPFRGGRFPSADELEQFGK